MITNKKAVKLAEHFSIDLNTIPLNVWKYALEVELEHGKRYGHITNVTNNNLNKTAMIALAHLIEYPDYYQRLYMMENEAEIYWKNKRKPNIFKE